MYCEAIKVDIANSKETSFKNSSSSTLSLITVLFEDLFEAININTDFCGEKLDPQCWKSSNLVNFNLGLSKNFLAIGSLERSELLLLL